MFALHDNTYADLQKIAALNKWDEENPKKKQALECLQLVWEGLKKYADENAVSFTYPSKLCNYSLIKLELVTS